MSEAEEAVPGRSVHGDVVEVGVRNIRIERRAPGAGAETGPGFEHESRRRKRPGDIGLRGADPRDRESGAVPPQHQVEADVGRVSSVLVNLQGDKVIPWLENGGLKVGDVVI